MNIFLTGATGYIGTAVAEALIRRGHVVTGLARSEEAAAKLRSVGVIPFSGDMRDVTGISEAAKSSDGVIHAASTNGPDAPEADLTTVRSILGSLEGSKKPFIYTSGIWVLGDTGNMVADEQTTLRPTPLVAWRPAVEQLVLDAAKQNVRSTVIRPAIVYGHGKGLVVSFTKSAKETGAARYIGTGENRWPLVHVDDLAELYLIAIERATPGTLLFAAYGPSLRVRRIAEESSRAAGAEGKTTSWPIEEARAELGQFADALILDQQVSAARAISEYGWAPKGPSLLEEISRSS